MAWPFVRPHLKPAIDKSGGRWTSDYVLAALALNEQSLWVVVNEEEEIVGAATTEVVYYPESKFLAIHFLGGDSFDEWYSDLLDALTHAAEHFSCAGIECNARHGFWKWFKQDGFAKASTFYEKLV